MLSSMDPLPYPVLNAVYWILLLVTVSSVDPPFQAKPHQGSSEQGKFLQANNVTKVHKPTSRSSHLYLNYCLTTVLLYILLHSVHRALSPLKSVCSI